MTVLGIDTSFLSDTAVGIYISEDEQVELTLKASQSQEEKLFSAIDSALAILRKDIKDIDCFAVGIGPGSFTGIRIGIASAQSLAWAQGKKLAGISSLELLAASIPAELYGNDSLVVPVIDARMNRVFSAVFQNEKKVTGDLDIKPEDLINEISKYSAETVILLGDGLMKYGPVLNSIPGKKVKSLPNISVSGLTLCRKALEMIEKNPENPYDPKTVLPVYLRKSEAEVQWEQKNAQI